MDTKKKTRHFKNCLGVFQGGGCKALAFVGAYKEAVERGVFFSRVAGTSAGSIVAALIAAGASPQSLETAVLQTDFEEFKQEPEPGPVPADVGFGSHFLIATKRHRKIKRFLRNLGLFSSAKIEEWLETELKKLLGLTKGEAVTFKDLNIPLHVVATDLIGAKPKVWSYDETPDASVAYAVRCSCTIPIFFQAVDSTYVDGGVVSNLPSFVLNSGQSGSFEKLLCFTFATGQEAASPSTGINVADRPLPGQQKKLVEDYLRALMTAVIDGAVHIQTELQTNLHVIELDKLPLGTVDFHKVNKESIQLMFDAGRQAAERFFSAEVANLQVGGSLRSVLETETEILNHVVCEDLAKDDEIIIACTNTRYVYNLFPTLLNWRLSGINITFLCEPPKEKERKLLHEMFRRQVLELLGSTLIEVASLPFEAIFFRKRGHLDDMLLLHDRRWEKRPPCFGIRYEKSYDAAAIGTMYSAIKALIPASCAGKQITHPTIEIERVGQDELFRRLKRVAFYANKQVRLSLEEVDISRIVFLTKYIKSYKYNQIQRLFDIYRSKDIALFESAQIHFRTPDFEVTTPITPPVAEEHGDKLYLYEGNSRLTYLTKELGVKRVKLVVVREVDSPPPTKGRFSPGQLLITNERKIGENRYEKFDYALFRDIEEAVHDPELYLERANA